MKNYVLNCLQWMFYYKLNITSNNLSALVGKKFTTANVMYKL